jgi:hypothetical protein
MFHCFFNKNMESDREKYYKSNSDHLTSILKLNTDIDIHISSLSEYE